MTIIKKTFNKLMAVTVLITVSVLAGCASESLKAPCPDYGKYCDKKPVNSWDTSAV